MTKSKDILWHLQQINLFADLKPDELTYVSSCFVDQNYPVGKELPLGETNLIYLVKSGLVELASIDEQGKKVIIDLLQPGSLFGTVIKSNAFYYTARVRKPAKVCHMPTTEFFSMVSRYHKASQKLLVHLHRQLSLQQERISSLATESVLDRLVRILRMLPFSPKIEKITLTHEELAQMVGTSRQTVSTMLKNLQNKGLVTKKDGQYIITDVS